jgi:cell division protein FtsZ
MEENINEADEIMENQKRTIENKSDEAEDIVETQEVEIEIKEDDTGLVDEIVKEKQHAKQYSAVVSEQSSNIANDLLKGGDDDEELLTFLNETKPKICIIGCGGAGCNTIARLSQMNVKGAELIALNTDVHHLLKMKCDKKLLIGKKLTKGMGAGSNPEIGEAAAKESKDEIEKAIEGASMIFITGGMGGGTGTGSGHIVAEVAKNKGILTVGIVTLPFFSEGRQRRKNALDGLNRLRKKSDTTIVIPNDKLLTLAPDLPLNTAFKLSDEILAGAAKGITELITKAGLVNLDFADMKTILLNGGYAVIGTGESTTSTKPEERARYAIEMALNSPLIDATIDDAGRALINVIGGADMTLREAELMATEVADKIAHDSHIIWGARIDESLPKNVIKVLVVIAGAEFPEYKLESEKIDKIEVELDSI